jgi:hypothetical protein
VRKQGNAGKQKHRNQTKHHPKEEQTGGANQGEGKTQRSNNLVAAVRRPCLCRGLREASPTPWSAPRNTSGTKRNSRVWVERVKTLGPNEQRQLGWRWFQWTPCSFTLFSKSIVLRQKQEPGQVPKHDGERSFSSSTRTTPTRPLPGRSRPLQREPKPATTSAMTGGQASSPAAPARFFKKSFGSHNIVDWWCFVEGLRLVVVSIWCAVSCVWYRLVLHRSFRRSRATGWT